jgi:hypothetical protein
MALPIPGNQTNAVAPYYNYKSHTGNRIIIRFNGAIVGLVQSLRASEDFGVQGLYQVGDIQAAELVPTQAQYTLTADMIFLKTDTFYSGFGSSTPLAPVDPYGALYFKPFQVAIYDSDTMKLMRYWDGCYYSQGDLQISMNAVLTGSCTFRAITASGSMQTLGA